MSELRERVSIVGVGCSPFGDVLETPELKGMTERELASWAALEAMEDAGVEAKDIDAFYIGHCMDEQIGGSINTAPVISDWIGMRNKPGLHHEAACATGGMGLWLACQAVASGMYRTVLSVGVEILRSKPIARRPPHMRQPLSLDERNSITITNDRAYGDRTLGIGGDPNLMLYAKKYGVSLSQLEDASIAAAINARYNAVRNPLATLTKTHLVDEATEHGYSDVGAYMRSSFNPKRGMLVRQSDFYMHADGASAVIVCPSELARAFTDSPIDVTGLGVAASSMYHSQGLDRESDTAAFTSAFDMAGLDASKDVHYMYSHDAQLCNQFLAAETAGYLPRGEGWQAVIEGRTALAGDKPTNTSGGRTAMGHAYAASVGAEIVEAVRQMRGKCGARQIKPTPVVSLVHGLGGGHTSFAGVLQTR